ncbi:MAG: VWA domain-containing protein [Treponema sp.]|jgi:Ca-activated chloride channel family protein|nr:VWA domain-containing protein [Treponema sp.]
MTLGFERPFFLAAALVILLLLLLASRYLKPLLTLEIPLGPPGGIPFKSPVNLDFLIRLLRILELAGVLLLFIAAAGPRFVHTEAVWLSRGADILFVVDISPSMAGMDMNGRSRFDAARELVRDFALRRPSDAIGLAAVGEDAALLLPLTTDRESLLARLDTLGIGELGDGTALGLGLAMAGLHMGRPGAPRRAVVLITDGENNAGSVHPETAAAMLVKMDVSLWVIGVGSRGEIPVNYVDPITKVRRTGTFESRFNPESLERIALSGEGTWIYAPQAEAFSSAFSRLDQGEMTIRRSGVSRRTDPFHGIFIAGGLFLILGVRLIRRLALGALL